MKLHFVYFVLYFYCSCIFYIVCDCILRRVTVAPCNKDMCTDHRLSNARWVNGGRIKGDGRQYRGLYRGRREEKARYTQHAAASFFFDSLPLTPIVCAVDKPAANHFFSSLFLYYDLARLGTLSRMPRVRGEKTFC